MRRRIALIASFMMAFALMPIGVAQAGPASCDMRVNNTIAKLLECVELDGVRVHQAALQAIADANNGIRTSGTPGYDASKDYVVEKMEAAGYDVTVQPFEYTTFLQLGPSTLEQIAPVPVAYVEDTDYSLMTQTAAGDVSGSVTGVGLALGTAAWPDDPSTSTSGCDIGDFTGFPPGDVALLQRGACSFELKAENAAAAGAVGAIIFNRGDDP